MKNFTVLVAKIVGTPTATSWAQTLVQDNLYVVLEISGIEDVASIGKNLFILIGKELKSQQKQNLASLKETVVKTLQDSPTNCQVNMTVVQTTDGGAYIVIKGGGSVFLRREGVLLRVLSAGKEEVIAGSGFLKEKDLLILATPKLEKLITKGQLSDNLDNFAPEEIAERLSPRIHESEEGSGVACIILSFNYHPAIEADLQGVFPMLKKYSLVIAIILIAILLLSIIFGVKTRTQKQRSEEFKKSISQAITKYEEGRQLLDLNRTLAHQELLTAKKILDEEKLSIEGSSKEDKEVQALLAKIEELIVKSGKIYRMDSAQTFFDVTLIKGSAIGSRLAIGGEQLAILDMQNNSIYSLSLTNKSSQISGANLQRPQLLATDTENIYVLDEEGVQRVDKGEKNRSLIIEKDDSNEGLGGIVGMSAFLSNIYLLDKKASTIHKYIPSGDTYVRRNYLAPDIKADFSNAVSFTVDGAVYVLLQDGTILKYLQGAPKSFRISGLDIPFLEPLAIFTNSDLANLYLLDKGNKRVVVLDKEGGYQAQYQWEGIKDATDIVASEKEGKILLLSGSKIYAIAISH